MSGRHAKNPISDEINHVMGNTRSRNDDPHTLMYSARKLDAEIRKHLGRDTFLPSDELVEAILSVAVDEFKSDPMIMAAGVMLGFDLISSDRIDEWKRQGGARWLNDDHVALGLGSVLFRRWVALKASGMEVPTTARAVLDRQKNHWAPAMAKAVRSYLRSHLDEARRVIKEREQKSGVVGELSGLRRQEIEDSSARWKIDNERHTKEIIESKFDYVHRPDIEERFRGLIAGGEKLIAFVGQAGMGKTSLARALAEGCSFVEFHDGRPNLAYLQPGLRKYGIPADDLSVSNAERKLVDLLTTSRGPRFVVLDNLQSTSALRQLVPPTTAAITVATCREIGSIAPHWCRLITVGVMSRPEAIDLAKRRLPSSSAQYSRLLADSLNCYPLVITVACGYIQATGIDARALCSSLQADPGSILASSGVTLRDILNRTVDTLRKRNPLAVELLACSLWPHPASGISLQSLVNELHGPADLTVKFEDLYGSAVWNMKYAEAIAELYKFGLLEVEVQDRSRIVGWDLRPRQLLHIHPLIRAILIGELEGDRNSLDAKLCERIEYLVGPHLDQIMSGLFQPTRDMALHLAIMFPIWVRNAREGSDLLEMPAELNIRRERLGLQILKAMDAVISELGDRFFEVADIDPISLE